MELDRAEPAVLGQGCDGRRPKGRVRLAEGEQGLRPALQERRRAPVDEHDEGARRARGPARRVGPGEGCAVRLGGVGGREGADLRLRGWVAKVAEAVDRAERGEL